MSKDQVTYFFQIQHEVKEPNVEYYMDHVRKPKGGVDASFFEDVNMIPDLSMIPHTRLYSFSMMLC